MTFTTPSESFGLEQPMRYDESALEDLIRELAEKELELATLENALLVFEKRYARTIGVLFAELDSLEANIAKEMLRLHPEKPYQEGFRNAEQRARSSNDAVNEKAEVEEKQPYIPSEEIKNLFRKVAKAIHPDLSVNEEEREVRTRLMARANAAFNNGDKEALEQILFEWEHRDEKSINTLLESTDLNMLEQKILQIKARLKEIGIKMNTLKASELYQLMVRVEKAYAEGRDLLEDMAKDLQEKITCARGLLESLKEQ